MNRWASGYGKGSIKMLSITLKIAVDAPIPNSQRDDRHRCKSRSLPQVPQCVADILPQVSHVRPIHLTLIWLARFPLWSSADKRFLTVSQGTHWRVIKFDVSQEYVACGFAKRTTWLECLTYRQTVHGHHERF